MLTFSKGEGIPTLKKYLILFNKHKEHLNVIYLKVTKIFCRAVYFAITKKEIYLMKNIFKGGHRCCVY